MCSMNSLSRNGVFLVVRMLVLEILEVVERLFAVENVDVLRLRWSQLSYGP